MNKFLSTLHIPLFWSKKKKPTTCGPLVVVWGHLKSMAGMIVDTNWTLTSHRIANLWNHQIQAGIQTQDRLYSSREPCAYFRLIISKNWKTKPLDTFPWTFVCPTFVGTIIAVIGSYTLWFRRRGGGTPVPSPGNPIASNATRITPQRTLKQCWGSNSHPHTCKADVLLLCCIPAPVVDLGNIYIPELLILLFQLVFGK